MLIRIPSSHGRFPSDRPCWHRHCTHAAGLGANSNRSWIALKLNSRPMLLCPASPHTGAPLRFVPQTIPGYTMFPGAAFYGTMSYLGHKEYEYSCPGSLAPGSKPCTFLGTAEDVYPRCDADPLCLGFVHFPAGREYSGGLGCRQGQCHCWAGG